MHRLRLSDSSGLACAMALFAYGKTVGNCSKNCDFASQRSDIIREISVRIWDVFARSSISSAFRSSSCRRRTARTALVESDSRNSPSTCDSKSKAQLACVKLEAGFILHNRFSAASSCSFKLIIAPSYQATVHRSPAFSTLSSAISF